MVSLRLLAEVGATADSSIIDVGGGDYTLVDALVDQQYRFLTVLDVSGAALSRGRDYVSVLERARSPGSR